jgi:hypothetical protein
MNDTTLQLTIRGIDPDTKNALIKKASRQGLSLNRYVIKALQNNIGLNDYEHRYQAIKNFLSAHSMNKIDKKTFDDAVLWSDKTSIKKQNREESDDRI